MDKFEVRELAEQVLFRLNHLGAYVYKEAETGSTYIKFKDPAIGSLRISDHSGRKKYSYRWNLYPMLQEHQRGMRVDGEGIRRWYYDGEVLDDFIRHICNYAAKIKKNRAIDMEIAYGDAVL